MGRVDGRLRQLPLPLRERPLGEWPPIASAPRRQALVPYVAGGFEPYAGLPARLGPHTTGKGCLSLERLADVDRAVLAELVATSFERTDGRTVTP
ncbi:hypothetical protein [Kitasatospora sp. NPDC093679]|uniref:hypothetical protein n=1 Tax=Kitasatospora sp. NPDC093679 TaxID=3154983 RepID=UPI0034488687